MHFQSEKQTARSNCPVHRASICRYSRRTGKAVHARREDLPAEILACEVGAAGKGVSLAKGGAGVVLDGLGDGVPIGFDAGEDARGEAGDAGTGKEGEAAVDDSEAGVCDG